jgi:hypothetical protein
MEQKVVLQDYLKKYHDTSFEDLPLNEVDILVLTGLCYADYMSITDVMDDFDIWNDKIPLSVFKNHEMMKKLSMRYLSGPVVYYNFFKDVLLTTRYRDLRITKIRNVFSKSKHTQFFAMVYEINDLRFVIFRGTDNTIPGWKEDILTAMGDEIPSQKLAIEYLKDVLNEDKDHNYYIIGHSKGGNLAYYAFFNLDDKLKERIIKCYNLDGNGFKKDNFPYKTYKKQIKKIVPSDDVVGCFFDTYSKHTIVKSANFSIFAHDVLSWQLQPNDYTKLLEVKNLTRASQAFKVVFNNWITKMTEKQLGDFIDFIFVMVDLEKAKTVNELLTNLSNNRHDYLLTIENYPEERKKEIRKLTGKFLRDYLEVYIRISPITKRLVLLSNNKKIIKEK